MAHAARADNPFRGYEAQAGWGAVLTVCSTFINPILGAAMGAYHVTNITTNLIADHFRMGEGPVGRVARVALTVLASFGAAIAVFCALAGTVVTLTPGVIGVGISLLCLSILATIVSET